jgi:hypothetical protein
MKNKNMIIIGILVIGVAAGSFFGGMKYQQGRRSANFRQLGAQGQRMGVGNANGNRVAGGFRPVSGEIISMDDKSITVKLTDGSTKIVIYSTSTKVNKTSEGTISDLKTGEQIMVVGTAGTDGTVTAQNISVGGNLPHSPRPSGVLQNQ